MTGAGESALNVGHPAPQRHAANPVLLLFALFGGPLGWMGQLLFAFASTSYVCSGSVNVAVPGWLAPALILLNIAGLAVAIAAVAVALRLLRRTAHEHRARSGGAPSHSGCARRWAASVWDSSASSSRRCWGAAMARSRRW